MAIRSRAGARPAPGQRPGIEWLETRCVLSSPSAVGPLAFFSVDDFVGPVALAPPATLSVGGQGHGPGHSPGKTDNADTDEPGNDLVFFHGHQKGNTSPAAKQSSSANASSASQSILAAFNSFLKSLTAEFGSGSNDSTGSRAATSGVGVGNDNDGDHSVSSIQGNDGGFLGPVVDAGAMHAAAASGAEMSMPGRPSAGLQLADSEKAIDGASAAMLLRDRMASVVQTASTVTADNTRDGKSSLMPENYLSRQSAALLRVAPAGFLDMSGDDQSALQTPPTLRLVTADEATPVGAETLTPLAAEGSARLLDCLPKEAQVLHDAMRRFFDRLDSLEDGSGTPTVAKAATAAPWLLTGALLTVAGDAARRTARRATGWAAADRTTSTEPWGTLPGWGF
jgi:hypothetical protein